MSTIRVDNFGPSAGGTTYSADGISKGYVVFNGFAVTIGDSLNNSSLTDNGSGDFNLNHTNAFSSIQYGHTGGLTYADSVTSAIFGIEGVDGTALSSIYKTTHFRANTFYAGNGFNRTNYGADRINIVFNGDLA